MKKTLLIGITLCALCGLALTANVPDLVDSPMKVDSAFVSSSFWDDGKAEVAKYQAKRTIYGKVREFEYVMVTVKEDFNKEHKVKTDDYSRDDLFPVIKVNLFARAETDNYPYHFMTSMFFRRHSPAELYKLTGNVQEWCGTSFKRLQRSDDELEYRYDSYWDGEGAGQKQLDQEAVFEDQLFYTLRTLRYDDGMTFTQDVYPSLIRSKAKIEAPISADFMVQKISVEVDSTSTAGMQGVPAWKVTMERADGATAVWVIINNDYHHLYSFTHSDGRSWKLSSVERSAYWNH